MNEVIDINLRGFDLEKFMNDFKDDILFAYNNNPPISKASGFTGKGFEIRNINPLQSQLWGYSYSKVLETGHGPARVPYNFALIIKNWAIAKGITFATVADLNRFAYFTAEKIQREGTALYRNGGRTDIFTEEIENLGNTLLNNLSILFTKEIKNEIFK